MVDPKIRAFIGTWKLVSIETRNKDGQVFRRGKRIGYLMYNEEGYMSVAFMKKGRQKFTSGDIRGGKVEEKLSAIEGYVSYCGRYEVKDSKVIHHIEVSLFPNWVGVKQERIYEFDGERLTLSTPLMLVGGIQLSTHVIWKKASKSEIIHSP
jgi:hypothetical protein